MQEPVAAIDIGTNTIRLLIGRRLPNGQLHTLNDQTVTVRLGQGVDSHGRLAPDRMERAITTIAALAQQARAAGVSKPLVVATSAVRDAANAREFVTLVLRDTGLMIDVIDGQREAALTFRGAMLGHPVSGTQLVADIGGGSTEVIIATDGHVSLTSSLQIGSGRLTERCLPSDPPTPAEITIAQRTCRLAFVQLPIVPVDQLLLVGGTATTLLQLEPLGIEGNELSRGQIAGVLFWLLTTPAQEIADRFLVDPARARVLAAGTLIIEELMAHYKADRATICRGGLREGLLLEHVEAGVSAS